MTTRCKLALFAVPLLTFNLAVNAQEKPKAADSEASRALLEALKNAPPAGEASKPAEPSKPAPTPAGKPGGLPGFSEVAPSKPAAPTPATPADPNKPKVIVVPGEKTTTPVKPETSIKPVEPAEPSKVSTQSSYKVQSGDTLSSIALSFYGDESKWAAIAKANPTVDPIRLKVGQSLKLPDLEVQKKERERELDDVKVELSKGDGTTKLVQVEPGDNLGKIAQRVYGKASKWRVIYDANRDQLPNENDLEVGMKLKVPALPGEKPAATETTTKPVDEIKPRVIESPAPDSPSTLPTPAPAPTRLPVPTGPVQPAPKNKDGTKG